MELTAAASVPKKKKQFSPMLHYCKWNIRSNRKLMIILTVLHMVAAPAVFFSTLAGIFSGRGLDYSSGIYMSIGTLTTLAAGFMGIIIAINSFDCLHKKSVVDMKLSLPMTADQRFVSDFLSGLFVYIAPFLAAQVVSLLLACFGLVFLEGRTLYKQSLDSLRSVPYVCDYFTDATFTLLKLILCGILTMLMLYTLTVLITVCCGSRFECIVYSIGVNIVIPLTINMVTRSMFDGIFGIDPDYNAARMLMVTSPAGGIFTAERWAFDGTDHISDYMHPAVWAVLFFLLTALMGVLAFCLYRKRRAEQVSKPFVFKLVYYIMITGVTFCIFSAFCMGGSFIPGIITTAVIYMIAEAVTNRGFRRFWLSGIKYAVTVIAEFLLICYAHVTGGFGAMYVVPANVTVSSVEVSYSGIYNDFGAAGREGIVLKDKGNIKAVTSAHKKILEEYKKYLGIHPDFYDRQYYNSKVLYSYTLTIKYRLVNGMTIERAYTNNITSDVAEILSSIDYTDEYKEQLAEYYTEKIKTWKEQFPKVNYDNKYDGYKATLMRQERNDMLSETISEVSTRYLYNNGFYDSFAEAYAADIMAMDRDNYSASYGINKYAVYILSDEGYFYSYVFRIPMSFENTLRVLEEYGFDVSAEVFA